LLAQADLLLRLSPRRPKQANLRRAVSAAYYAVFHSMCWSNANCLAGTGAAQLSRAWSQTYRAVDHAQAKKRCASIAGKGFPKPIEDFADAFVALQEHRHRADYSPDQHFTKPEAVAIVGLARSAVAAMSAASARHRKAFALHVLLTYRT
jgi:hypothetical protein